LSATYSTLAPGEELEAVYESSWIRRGIDEDGEEAFVEALGMTGAEERQRRTTVVGPHRDDIRFLLGGRDARTYASQGQQRTISLAWKLAEVSVITDVGGQQPLLLLDDVMSELDEARRLTLTSLVGEVAQTVVTTTNLGYFGQEIVNRAKVVNLS
jgi:DNA replication and repair protein RecF